MRKHDDTSSRVALAILILAGLFAMFFFWKPQVSSPTTEGDLDRTVIEESVEQTQKLTIEITDGKEEKEPLYEDSLDSD